MSLSLLNITETKRRFLGMLLLVLITFSFVAFACCICLFHKSVNWDSARGILAAMQYEDGISPNIVTLATADPANLDKQLLQPEAFRSPGYQAIPLLFRSFCLSWEMSVRLTILLFLSMGFLAWGVCYGLVLTNKRVVMFLVLTILCSPWMIRNVHIYHGGDILIFGFIPVLLLVNFMALWFRTSIIWRGFAILGGFLSTTVILLKYSGIFVGIGIGIGWLVLSIRERRIRNILLLWGTGAVAGLMMIIMLGYPWGPTPATITISSMQWKNGFLALGTWPVSMTDLSACIERGLYMFGVSPARHIWAPIVGLFFFFILFVMLYRYLCNYSSTSGRIQWFREAHGNSYAVLMLSAFITDVVCYAGIIVLGGDVEVSARLARISALLVLPFVFIFIVHFLVSCRGFKKVPIIIFLIPLFFIGPLLGFVRLIRFEVPTLFDSQLWANSSTSIRNAEVGSTIAEQQDFYAEVLSYIPAENTVLLVTKPEMLFVIPRQRCLLVYVVDKDYTDKQLRSMQFRGSPDGGVVLLLPGTLRVDGRASALCSAFMGIDEWECVTLRTDPEWDLWISSASIQLDHSPLDEN